MKTLKIELVVDNEIVEVLKQDEEGLIWTLSEHFIYPNELKDYINCIFDNPHIKYNGVPF